MIEKSYIVDSMNQLRLRTKTYIDEYQRKNTIRTYDLQLELVDHYIYDTVKTYITPDLHFSVFRVLNLPMGSFCNRSSNTYVDSIINLVDANIVNPFLIFIDGKAIPWSEVTIISDNQNTYISIARRVDPNSIISSIILPRNIDYGEDEYIDPTKPNLYFNSNGYLCVNNFNDIAIRIEILDDNYVLEKHILQEGQNVINFWPKGYEKLYVLSKYNTIHFSNVNNEYSLDLNEVNINHKGFGVYKINDAKEDDLLIITYNTNCFNNISYIDNMDEDVKKIIMDSYNDFISSNNSEDGKIVTKILSDIFDFSIDNNLSFEENLIKNLKYTLNYNYKYIKDLFVESSRVITEEYTGEELLKLSDIKNSVNISRARSNAIVDYVIIFKNNKLYEYYYLVKYNASTINIPIYNIKNDDIFSIVFFTNVNNIVADFSVKDSKTRYDFSNMNYKYKELELYSTEFIEDMVYDFEKDEKFATKIECKQFKYEDNTIRFEFENDIYYNKDIKIASKRQFRYARYTGLDNISNVKLNSDFKYCHNKNQYLVFINKVKINSTNYAIVFPTTTSPFKSVLIYFPVILEPTDIVEVFYVPEEINYIEQSNLDLNGSIVVDFNKLNNHILSKDLQLFFINGNFIHKKDITDLTKNRVRINYTNSTHNISILDTLDNIELISSLISATITGTYIMYGQHYSNSIISTSNSEIDEIINSESGHSFEDNDDLMEDIASVIYSKNQNKTGSILNDKNEATDLDIDNIINKQNNYEDIITVLKHSTESDDDSWSKFISSLSDDQISIIFGSINKVSNDEEDIKEWFHELKTAIYDILYDNYIVQQKVPLGSEFVFDIDYEDIDVGKDENGTRILSFGDATLQDKLYEYPINQE